MTTPGGHALTCFCWRGDTLVTACRCPRRWLIRRIDDDHPDLPWQVYRRIAVTDLGAASLGGGLRFERGAWYQPWIRTAGFDEAVILLGAGIAAAFRPASDTAP